MFDDTTWYYNMILAIHNILFVMCLLLSLQNILRTEIGRSPWRSACR